MVELLINYGAEIDAKNSDGATPLFSIFYGYSYKNTRAYSRDSSACDMAKVLVSKGANVMVADDARNTVLHCAVKEAGNWDIAFFDALLAAGAKINARNRYGQTPLDLAESSSRASPKLIKWIRAHGGKNGKEKKASTTTKIGSRTLH